MYFLVYVSSAVKLFSNDDLSTLLEVSRLNNRKVGVTGLLLYSAGNFMQVLEGPEEEVRQTHGRILRDPRHIGAITLLQGQREEREFADWSMGFKQLHPADASVPGYSDFMNGGLTGPEPAGNASSALALLTFFRKNMR